jgi:hypothetical protein
VLVLFFLNKEKYSRNLNRNLENKSRGLIIKQAIHTKKVRKEKTFFNVKKGRYGYGIRGSLKR